MAGLLPPVVATLGANISSFKKGMHDAKGEMAAVEKSGGSSFNKLAAGVTAGLALGGAAVAGFAASSLSKFESVAGEVSKMSRLTGESAESMSAMRYEAQQTGVPIETLTKSMVKVSKAVQAGDKTFAKYGIATKDAAGKTLSMSQIMANSADVFKNMPNGIEKNALAVKLFGKAGVDMIPMLNKGSEGLAALSKQGEQFGLILGDKDIDAMKKNKVAHRQMSAAWEGLQVQIGKHLMPVVAQISVMFAKYLPTAMALVKKGVALMVPAFTLVGSAIAWLTTWIQAHWEQIKAGVSAAIEFVRQVIQTGVAVVMALWSRFGSNIVDVLQHAWAMIQTVVKSAILIVQGIIEVVTNLIHGRWAKVWEGIQKIIHGVWDAIIGYVKYALDLMKNIFQIAWKVIQDLIPLAWELIKKAVKAGIDAAVALVKALPGLAVAALVTLGPKLQTLAGAALKLLWTGIQDGIAAGWHFIKDLPGHVLDALGSIGGELVSLGSSWIHSLWDGLKAAWNWLADKVTVNLPEITIPTPFGDKHFGGGTISLLPHLATGGRIAESGLAVVGERGREVVALPKGAQVFPNGSAQERGNGAGGLTVENHFHGITDMRELTRLQTSEMMWALKTAVAI